MQDGMWAMSSAGYIGYTEEQKTISVGCESSLNGYTGRKEGELKIG